jgi:hypothetical protein
MGPAVQTSFFRREYVHSIQRIEKKMNHPALIFPGFAMPLLRNSSFVICHSAFGI